MQVEKALRINLPDGIEFRGVEVTDGGLLITYAIENDIDFVILDVSVVLNDVHVEIVELVELEDIGEILDDILLVELKLI